MQRTGAAVLAIALLLVGAWLVADGSSISTLASTPQARRLFGGPAEELQSSVCEASCADLREHRNMNF